MSELVKEDQWVWVVVQDPGGDEQFLGQHDEERDISFIPVFLGKKEAEEGLSLLSRERDRKYEVQAILIEDLSLRAAANGFTLYILNGKGEILEKMMP
ncbi:MAG: hypothetical protein ABII06_12865 [Pseudomonadota bacterium]